VTIEHLRIARATNRLTEMVAFYRELFEFEIVGSFEDHEGFDGVMLGPPDGDFHFEFTHEKNGANKSGEAPEDLIVLYLREAEWLAVRNRMTAIGVGSVASHNPYWDRHGVTITDPDGHRIALHRGAWGSATG